MGIIFRNKQQKLGKEVSHYYLVDWNSVVPKQSRFSREHEKDICSKSPRLIGKNLNADDPNFNFNNESLDTLRLTNNLIDFKDGCWWAETYEEDNILGIRNVQFEDIHNILHKHNVASDMRYQDVGVLFEFENQNQTYLLKLDNITPISTSRFVNFHGSIGEDDSYQIGLLHMNRYDIVLGDKIFLVFVEFTFVFKYENNDFEPIGTINASKILPQCKFDSALSYLSEWTHSLTGCTDVTNNVQTALPTVDLNKAKIRSFKCRLKSDINVSNEHHIASTDLEATSMMVNNTQLNYKVHKEYLKSLRVVDPLSIPQMFEKIFIDTAPKNSVGFFSDSNESAFFNNRKKPPYQIGLFLPVTSPITIFPLQKFEISPTSNCWWNIFDNTNYNVQKEFEFDAVYGMRDNRFNSLINDFSNRTNLDLFPYPDASHSVLITKAKRQGAYDNIHLHGYLGNYLDQYISSNTSVDSAVVHAPICGYCCFHMHWRWSSVNYYTGLLKQLGRYAAKNLPTIIGGGLLEIPKIVALLSPKIINWDEKEYRFKGWDYNSDKEFVSNQTQGMPLIPPNQSLKIAVTKPGAIPFNDNEIINPLNNRFHQADLPLGDPSEPSGAIDLDSAVKSIWYDVEILRTSHIDNHVVMEQGCGYASSYSLIGEMFIRIMGFIIKSEIEPFSANPTQAYPEFFNYISSLNASVSDLYEIHYRLMRYYNFGDFFDSDQVPTLSGASNIDMARYSLIKKIEKL